MEVQYYKDYRHNYLIIKGGEEGADKYQCRMMIENRIQGLLLCKVKHINGELLFYYEISSMQTFASFYDGGHISMIQLKQLFIKLKKVWEELSKYLLDEKNLILLPEYIYMDIETKELCFLYYPFRQEENNIMQLFEFLIEKVDTEDREAVDMIYKIFELAEKEQFVLDEILLWFEQEKEEEIFQDSYVNKEDMYEENEWEEERDSGPTCQNSSDKMKNRFAVMGLLAGPLVGLGLYYISYAYQLTDREMIYFYAGIFLALILFFTGGVWLLYTKTIKHRSLLFVSKENERSLNDKPLKESIIYEKMQEKEDAVYGNTVFIPWIEKCENKLYGSGKGNKNHIDLKNLPLTVGKMAGSVDMVICDQSLSRRHVKFTSEGDKIYMTDLNSTNGTFKNGLRLEPNASEVLEPGDEIRLGKLKFIYR